MDTPTTIAPEAASSCEAFARSRKLDAMDLAESAMIRVLVIHESAVVALGLASLLARFPEIEVVREVRDPAAALAAAVECRPDILLAGVPEDPAAVAKVVDTLRRGVSGARIVALANALSTGAIRAAYEAGASAYVLRDDAPESLVEVLRIVFTGKRYVAPTVSELLLSGLVHEPEAAHEHTLSSREVEVLRLIAQGCSSRGIASELGIRVTTVHSHRASIMKKLNIHKTAGLVQHYMRTYG